MGGNILGGNFLGGNFSGGRSFPVGSLMGENFPGGSLPKTILPWSPSLTFQKNLFYLLQWKPFKNDKKCILFHLKGLLDFKVFKFSSWIFGHVEETAW